MIQAILVLAVLALGVTAQTTPFTDPNTGIAFASYHDSVTGIQIGLALPQAPADDFIGQIVGPSTNATGWTGLDLGPVMTSHLLIVAYPSAQDVVASFRYATGYAAPDVYPATNVSMYPITKGTFVNATHYSYTFLCKGCLSDPSIAFDPSAGSTGIGWAHSTLALTDQSDPSGTLTYHAAGSGTVSFTIADAESADYDTWAALASTSAVGSGSTSSPTATAGPASTSLAPFPTGSSGNSSSSSPPVVGSNSTASVSNVTYDFIVAGAGAAGLIVASRLAESGGSVLLLEGGGPSTYATGGRDGIPTWNNTVTQYDVPALDYYFKDAPYCTNTASQAGCLLGGGTAVNSLNFIRPQEKDFDDKWPVGWKWEDVSSSADAVYARNPGTINPNMDGKRYDEAAYNLVSGFLNSLGWSHVNALTEPNRKTNIYSYPPWNIQNGIRAGPLVTYLPGAQARPNFHLQLNTQVLRAVRTSSSITGVEVVSASGAHQIINLKPRGKVIFSAGALTTPRLLINSGIGPSAQLQIAQAAGTTLPPQSAWINLPVGAEVKDHPTTVLYFNTSDPGVAQTLYGPNFTNPSAGDIALFAQGSGPLAQSGQRLQFWTNINGTDGQTRYIQGNCFSNAPSSLEMKLYLTHGLTSVGGLGLSTDGQSTTFTKQPYYNTDGDKAAMSSFIDKILAATRQNSTLSLANVNGQTANSTGVELIKNVVPGTHFVGTAKMGTDDGRSGGSAVVDTNSKVYGTDNLYVVDASMHPDLPTGNAQAIIYVAAEHAVAKILAGPGSANATVASGAAGRVGAQAASVNPYKPTMSPSKKSCPMKHRRAAHRRAH